MAHSHAPATKYFGFNGTLATWSSTKSFVKDNHNHLILKKHFMDILLDEAVVNKAIFCDLAFSARPRGSKVQA